MCITKCRADIQAAAISFIDPATRGLFDDDDAELLYEGMVPGSAIFALAIEHISAFVAARTGWQVQMPVSGVKAGLRAAVQAPIDRYPGAVARHPLQ